jgi:alcohol dehydrogenase class IV
MASPDQGFAFSLSCPRVVFGSGTLRKLPEELSRLKVSYPVIVCSPTRASLARVVKQVLDGSSVRAVGIIDRAAVHVPADVTEAALKEARRLSPDAIISVGGGAAVGLGKALVLRTGWPHVCIPTTYSGSEMTAILGELKHGRKVAVTDPKILPATVIYDVVLTLPLPRDITAVSGVNALAHSSKYSNNKNSTKIRS